MEAQMSGKLQVIETRLYYRFISWQQCRVKDSFTQPD